MQAVAAVITCMSIIACSVGCVTLLGWEIGVLEAVILVLVVGLSFDYTLHYGAALPKTGCKLHRILRAAQLASVPVSLSATTSFLAGASMLFSQTHAFSQVGVFLIVLTACSWVFATFFFLPLLFLSIRPTKRCAECDNLAIPSYPMDEKFHS
ncbi:Protein dispatched [Trichostrongylus colubriformis]